MPASDHADKPFRRRSCLSVPGSSAKMLAKASALPADECVLDLEDAVAPAEKAEARALVAAALQSDAWADRQVSVRVNAIGSPWCHHDIITIAALPHPRLSLVIPKVESAQDIGFVERLLNGVEAENNGHRPLGMQALIETAKGLASIQQIASASARLETLILGYADLASSLGRPAASPASWRPAQDALLIAARSNDLQAIDGPYFRIQADEQLNDDSRNAADIGFDGKWAIHPSHLEPINAAFTPGADAVANARALLSSLAEAEKQGRGAVQHGGGMIDEAMRLGALRTLARTGEASS